MVIVFIGNLFRERGIEILLIGYVLLRGIVISLIDGGNFVSRGNAVLLMFGHNCHVNIVFLAMWNDFVQ